MRECRESTGPWIPGKASRLLWCDPGDPDQLLVREGVQEYGVHLYIMYLPFEVGGTQIKTLVEVYWPDELRDGSVHHLDPRQRQDFHEGRPVVWSSLELNGTVRIGGNELGAINAFFALCTPMIEEVRRNNRNALKELRRSHSAADLKLEMEATLERDENEKMAAWADHYVEAYEDTEKFALGKPRISMYGADRNG